MIRAGAAGLLCAGLVIVLLATPATGGHTGVVPTVKGFVVSRSARVLAVAGAEQGSVRVILGPRTRVGGLRKSAAAIAVKDLIRADGTVARGGGLEALYVEVIMTGDAVVLSRRRPGFSNFLLNWLVNGGPVIPLP